MFAKAWRIAIAWANFFVRAKTESGLASGLIPAGHS